MIKQDNKIKTTLFRLDTKNYNFPHNLPQILNYEFYNIEKIGSKGAIGQLWRGKTKLNSKEINIIFKKTKIHKGSADKYLELYNKLDFRLNNFPSVLCILNEDDKEIIIVMQEYNRTDLNNFQRDTDKPSSTFFNIFENLYISLSNLLGYFTTPSSNKEIINDKLISLFEKFINNDILYLDFKLDNILIDDSKGINLAILDIDPMNGFMCYVNVSTIIPCFSREILNSNDIKNIKDFFKLIYILICYISSNKKIFSDYKIKDTDIENLIRFYNMYKIFYKNPDNLSILDVNILRYLAIYAFNRTDLTTQINNYIKNERSSINQEIYFNIIISSIIIIIIDKISNNILSNTKFNEYYEKYFKNNLIQLANKFKDYNNFTEDTFIEILIYIKMINGLLENYNLLYTLNNDLKSQYSAFKKKYKINYHKSNLM